MKDIDLERKRIGDKERERQIMSDIDWGRNKVREID